MKRNKLQNLIFNYINIKKNKQKQILKKVKKNKIKFKKTAKKTAKQKWKKKQQNDKKREVMYCKFYYNPQCNKCEWTVNFSYPLIFVLMF